MKEKVIEFVTFSEIRSPYENIDRFEFRKDRPYKWLQKVCFYVLRKLCAYSISESVTIERHVLNGEKFIDRILKQRQELISKFNMEPDRLLIGAEDYADLMDETMSNHQFYFNATYGRYDRYLNLKVEVIPWMRGCIVMPKEKT